MRTKIVYITLIATILLFGACSNEDGLPEAETARTITLTATLPDDDPTTRVSLDENGLGMKVRWEEEDIIRLLYVQEDHPSGTPQVAVFSTKVKTITNDGKTAEFDLPGPTGSMYWGVCGLCPNTKFDIYGVYGGMNETTAINNTARTIQLPQQNWKRGTLEKIKSERDVTLRFEYKNATKENLNIKVKFEHLGSLFAVHLKNSAPAGNTFLNQLNIIRLVGDGDAWSYNSGNTHNLYQVETGTFQIGTGSGQELTNMIHFMTENKGLAPGKSSTTWAWFPPYPGKTWPVLRMALVDTDGDVTPIIESGNHPSGAKTPVAGETYHFYAEYNGTNLSFITQAQFEAAN